MTKADKRVVRTMFKEMICSEHGARCFLEAARRDRIKARADAALTKRRGK